MQEWKNPKNKKQRIFWTGPVLAGNRLWVASSRGQLMTVDVATGTPTLFRELKTSISLAPVVANQTLYLLDDKGVIHAFR